MSMMRASKFFRVQHLLKSGKMPSSVVNRTFTSGSRPVSQGDYHPDLDKAPYVLPTHSRIACPPMVYISGEEMTKHTMDLILEEWIRPHVDISAWEFYDLSCVSRASLR